MNWDTQRDIVEPTIKRLADVLVENATLRARVEKLEAQLAKCCPLCRGVGVIEDTALAECEEVAK